MLDHFSWEPIDEVHCMLKVAELIVSILLPSNRHCIFVFATAVRAKDTGLALKSLGMALSFKVMDAVLWWLWQWDWKTKQHVVRVTCIHVDVCVVFLNGRYLINGNHNFFSKMYCNLFVNQKLQPNQARIMNSNNLSYNFQKYV